MAQTAGGPMSEVCEFLHQRLSKLPHMDAGFDPSKVPASGVYLMFERGEAAHGTDRIIRIGTHSGRGRTLAQRLEEHFWKENKDRSIFRKHIGRCILSKREDPFLEQWNWDLTSRKNREQYGPRLNAEIKTSVEKEVTEHLTSNITFVTLGVDGKGERLALERSLLSTVASCGVCHSSQEWLGRFHQNERLRQAGLWNIQGLKGRALTRAEAEELMLYAS